MFNLDDQTKDKIKFELMGDTYCQLRMRIMDDLHGQLRNQSSVEGFYLAAKMIDHELEDKANV